MNPAIRDWSGKRVWVIGASTGIGGETARLLLARGARVALSARRQPELDVIAAESIAAGNANVIVAALAGR
jgi:short-subunit dehydrogenase